MSNYFISWVNYLFFSVYILENFIYFAFIERRDSYSIFFIKTIVGFEKNMLRITRFLFLTPENTTNFELHILIRYVYKRTYTVHYRKFLRFNSDDTNTYKHYTRRSRAPYKYMLYAAESS